MGHFGAIKEENLDPENHSGAILSVFGPFFGPQRTPILCSDQEYYPSVLGEAFGGPFEGIARGKNNISE